MKILTYIINPKIKNRLKILSVISLVCGFNLNNINPSWSKPITYDFTINVVESSLKGKTYNGFFSYDDESLTGNGMETINVAKGLKVCLNFFNLIHSEKKDVDYPEYPILIIKDGIPETLDFWMESNQRRIWWNRDGWQVKITPREENSLISNCDSLK